MKKLLALLITTLFLGQISYGADIEVAATMQTLSVNHDRVWSGAFQLAWNDLRAKTVHAPIRFPDGTSQDAIELNQRKFTIDNAPRTFYYKVAGIVKPNSIQKIKDGIYKKFNETSDMLNSVEMTPAKKRYFAYAMTKKNFQFIEPFDNLGTSEFGQEQNAEYYGLNECADEILRQNVKVLFYNNPRDYAIRILGPKEEDVILYRSVSNKPFNFVYGDILRKTRDYEGITAFTDKDTLKIPKIYISEEINYLNFADKRIKGTKSYLDSAYSSIKFSMDGSGIVSKKRQKPVEIYINPKLEIIPRNFTFDDTFFVFIKGRYSNRPYIAIRVNDISKFQ